MSCLYPVKIWLLLAQFRSPGTKTVLHEDYKIPKKYLDRYKQTVRPCGTCIECRLQKSAYIATRCVHQSKMSDHNCFLTLTYEDQNLPLDKSLHTRDMQLFWKKLRKQFPHKTIKYYAAGEYAPDTDRPHYHACVFNHDFLDRQYYKKTENDDKIYTSETLNDLWGHGHCFIGDVTFESAAYVARYTIKKIYGPEAETHYLRYHPDGQPYWLTPERSWSSQGLGEEWFLKYYSDVYPSDQITLYGGRQLMPPPYYDKLLLKHDPDLWERVQNQRAGKINKKLNNNLLERTLENGKQVTRTSSDAVRRASIRVGKLDKQRN